MNPNTPPPKDTDRQTNPSGSPPLSEKDFIRNGWTIASLPFWVWIFLTVAAAAIIWGSRGWYEGFLQKEKSRDPFLEVTNREFSVFLWQFPSYMRSNASKKAGYLTGFLSGSENFSPEAAEEFVTAPPDLIFLYHTWNRLLALESSDGPNETLRPIGPIEFTDFLEQLPEWKPANWLGAPQEYVHLIDSKSYAKEENLQTLPLLAFPLMVRQAYLGWRNYYKEGPQINAMQPTFAEVKAFIDRHPHYARNFWRNIEEVDGQKVAGLDYLSGFVKGTFIPDATVPSDQLSPFLKVGLYNESYNFGTGTKPSL